MASTTELLIKPRRGWQPADLGELWLYRELLVFLVWRDIKVRYKQTILGGLWAILQPLIATAVFVVLFSKVAHIHSDEAPYTLFVYSGLVPWTFFANALGLSSTSLLGSGQVIGKTYFPRPLVPIAAVLALVLDMLISFALMAVLLIYFRWHLTLALLWLPVFIVGSFLVASGIGLILSALNVWYRDVKYVVPFFIQMAFFLTPVAYPVQYVPAPLNILLGLNPMAGMVEGIRHALLGTSASWTLIGSSMVIGTLLFVLGLYVFRRMERTFADVI